MNTTKRILLLSLALLLAGWLAQAHAMIEGGTLFWPGVVTQAVGVLTFVLALSRDK